MIHHFWPIAYEINWALAGQILVVWIVVGLAVAPLIGQYLHNLRTKREFEGHLARSRECARLEKLVQLADEHDAAKTDAERQRIFRKATELGFTMPDETEYHAFMDEGEGPRAA